MNELEAAQKVRQMYARHGKEPRDVVVIELADEMLAASCHTCAGTLVVRAGREGKTPLTVPAFRAQMRDASVSIDHGKHVGQGDRAVAVGEIESWWRQEAPKHIRRFVRGDQQMSLLIAALMWSAGCLQKPHLIVEDLEDGTWHHPWVGKAEAVATAAGGLTRDVVEAAFTDARRRATEEAA